MGDLWYLALAYGAIWLGLFVYLFRLGARAEGLRREVGLLRAMLQPDEGAAGQGLGETMASTGPRQGEARGET